MYTRYDQLPWPVFGPVRKEPYVVVGSLVCVILADNMMTASSVSRASSATRTSPYCLDLHAITT